MKYKITSLVLAFVLLAGSMGGCTKKEETKKSSMGHEYSDEYDTTKYNEPGTYPVFKDKQVITVDVASSSYVEDFNTNTQTTLLEEDLNADLQMEVIPSKEYHTKINLMVAAGGDELKDAILGTFSDLEIMNYASSDVIAPVTDYYYNTSIGYNLNLAIDKIGYDYYSEITAVDGEIYGIAHYNDSIGTANPDKMYVFNPWLEQLGMSVEDVNTPEEYKAFLEKIRDNDLNGNGKNDEIPLVSSSGNKAWFRYLMNPYVYAGDSNYLVVEDGELSFAFGHEEEWKQGLKYMKSLYDEGLLSPLSFSQDSASMKSLQNSVDTVVGTVCCEGVGNISADDPRRQDYLAFAPLENKDGKKIATYTPEVADIRMLISKNASDIENTFRFGDLLVSDKYSLMTRWGQEGTGWKKASESDVSKYAFMGYKATMVSLLPWSTKQNYHWYQSGPYIRNRDVIGGVARSEGLNEVSEQPQMMYEGNNPDEYIRKMLFSEEDAQDCQTKLADLVDYVDEMTTSFVTGEKDIDKDWDSFTDQAEAMGGEELLTKCQEAFDAMEARYK